MTYCDVESRDTLPIQICFLAHTHCNIFKIYSSEPNELIAPPPILVSLQQTLFNFCLAN